jgi:aspartate racemase
MRKVGVIGGFGPATTAAFYSRVNALSRERGHARRPGMLIWNAPLPYEIEDAFIATGNGIENYRPYLLEAVRTLERGGADFLTLPCNSLHALIDEIRAAASAPVLSILEASAQALKKDGVSRVGILATLFTASRRLYDAPLRACGIEPVYPYSNTALSSVIARLLHDQAEEKDARILHDLLSRFAEDGVNAALLACTDLQLLSPSHPSVRLYDSMEILARATVNEWAK